MKNFADNYRYCLLNLLEKQDGDPYRVGGGSTVD